MYKYEKSPQDGEKVSGGSEGEPKRFRERKAIKLMYRSHPEDAGRNKLDRFSFPTPRIVWGSPPASTKSHAEPNLSDPKSKAVIAMQTHHHLELILINWSNKWKNREKFISFLISVPHTLVSNDFFFVISLSRFFSSLYLGLFSREESRALGLQSGNRCACLWKVEPMQWRFVIGLSTGLVMVARDARVRKPFESDINKQVPYKK